MSRLLPEDFVILVVDDEDNNRDLLSRRLARKGYRTEVAEDGPRALAVLADRHVDLVMLDIMMPGMSGLEVLRAIRKERDATALPVIMQSARSDTDDIVVALKLGANDYVTKPLNFPIVFARVLTALQLVDSSRRLVESERRYRTFTEQSSDLVSCHAPDGTFRYASRASSDLLGMQPDELLGTSLFDYVHARDRVGLAWHASSVPDVFTLVTRLRHKTGTHVWVEIRARTIRDEAGNPIEVLASSRDISEHIDDAFRDEPPPTSDALQRQRGWRTGEPVYEPSTEEPPVRSSAVETGPMPDEVSSEPPPPKRR